MKRIIRIGMDVHSTITLYAQWSQLLEKMIEFLRLLM